MLVIVLLILINALFAGGQFALVAVDRYQVEDMAAGGSRRARPLLRALRSLSFQLSGVQLGITASSLVLGFVVDTALTPALRPLLGWIPGSDGGSIVAITAGLALGLATIAQMVFGELAPKNVAIARPRASALLLAPPIVIFNSVVGPLVRMLNAAANWTMRRVGIEPREELEGVRSVSELRGTLRWAAQKGALHGVELELLDRSLSLSEKTARDVLVPRTSMVTLHADDSLADVARVARASGFSRFPVYARDGDQVVGIAHVKDVFGVPAHARAATLVTTAAQPPLVVPMGRDLRSLLVDMQTRRLPMAVIVDEFGRPAGIVTSEDVIEELLGEIEDEYDRPRRLAVRVGERTFSVEGLIRREELREATRFEIPPGRIETLAGLLLMLFQRIPQAGDRATYGHWSFRVEAMDGNRIARIQVTAPPPSRVSE